MGIVNINVNELWKLHRQSRNVRVRFLVREGWGDQMTAKETIARLCERVAALVAARTKVLDVVVWRNPGETEAEAIERYMPRAARTIQLVNWEDPSGV
jgi:hypothetical protein